MAGGGLMQLLSYGIKDIELTPRTCFICDIELLTLGRVYNTFQVINPYDDAFSEAIIIPNFYDNTLDTFF
jgi:hypothetical protein